MNYHNITNCDLLNGEGVRAVLWVAGCTHACEGCHNKQTWQKQSGIPFDVDAKLELQHHLDHPFCDGLTLSGGDPLAPYNYDETFELVKWFKDRYPAKTIWLYTGYTYEALCANHKDFDTYAKYIDVLVDGPFLLAEFDADLHYRGSRNQRLIRLIDGKPVSVEGPSLD